jgi:nucleotide-binding universal stress UspA family protein
LFLDLLESASRRGRDQLFNGLLTGGFAVTIDLKKVMCPVDFSDPSNHALTYALELARAFEAEVVLVHVIDVQFLSPYVVSEVPTVVPGVDELRKTVEQDLQALAEKSRKDYPAVAVRSLLLQGAPFVRIVESAREEQADLIVMGTHGRSGLSHLLIGSVAERVVRKAPCPVLTVKQPEHEFVHP